MTSPDPIDIDAIQGRYEALLAKARTIHPGTQVEWIFDQLTGLRSTDLLGIATVAIWTLVNTNEDRA